RSLVDRLRRFLSRDDLRRSARSTFLKRVDLRCACAVRNEPELDSAVQVRVAGFVRAGVAEVPHRDACTVDALLVHKVVTRVVGSGKRDAYTLRRIAVTVDDHSRARVLLEPDRYIV